MMESKISFEHTQDTDWYLRDEFCVLLKYSISQRNWAGAHSTTIALMISVEMENESAVGA